MSTYKVNQLVPVCATVEVRRDFKWVQRFGLAPMRLNLASDFRHRHLRGIYFRVIAAGRVCVGDPIMVERRGRD